MKLSILLFLVAVAFADKLHGTLRRLKGDDDNRHAEHRHRMAHVDRKHGKSGKFAVCPTGDCTDKSLTAQVDYIREIDTDGKKLPHHSKENMASTTFTVGTAETVQMGNPLVKATKYPFSSTIELMKGPGKQGGAAATAVLTVDTYTFMSPTNVTTGNTTVEVLADAMKFDVTVGAWSISTCSTRKGSLTLSTIPDVAVLYCTYCIHAH